MRKRSISLIKNKNAEKNRRNRILCRVLFTFMIYSPVLRRTFVIPNVISNKYPKSAISAGINILPVFDKIKLKEKTAAIGMIPETRTPKTFSFAIEMLEAH